MTHDPKQHRSERFVELEIFETINAQCSGADKSIPYRSVARFYLTKSSASFLQGIINDYMDWDHYEEG